MKTSIRNLLLLPESYSISRHMVQVERLLKAHPIFSRLYQLEKAIQPVLTNMEEQGLVVSKDWFTTGLQEKRNQLAQAGKEINRLIGSSGGDVVEEKTLRRFWEENDLPTTTTFDSLKKYKHLHPTYLLMMTYNNTQNYLKMWEQALMEKGVVVNGGVLLKGSWGSFSSYTGRITARNLPLTSMPSAMRDYIVSPIGQQIISLDLDNAELRILTHFSNCNALKEQFSQGIDVHAETAKLLRRNMAKYEVNDEQARQLAKQFTYSLLYGAGRQTITKNMQKVFHSITSADVTVLVDEFYELYPELLVFLEERADSPKLLTLAGEVKPVKEFTKTQKKNYALQAGVSVAIKLLMTTLDEHGIKIIHVLHDEVWILLNEKMNLENFIKQVEVKFEEKIERTFPGLPMSGILSKEQIGGKYNE